MRYVAILPATLLAGEHVGPGRVHLLHRSGQYLCRHYPDGQNVWLVSAERERAKGLASSGIPIGTAFAMIVTP